MIYLINDAKIKKYCIRLYLQMQYCCIKLAELLLWRGCDPKGFY